MEHEGVKFSCSVQDYFESFHALPSQNGCNSKTAGHSDRVKPTEIRDSGQNGLKLGTQ